MKFQKWYEPERLGKMVYDDHNDPITFRQIGDEVNKEIGPWSDWFEQHASREGVRNLVHYTRTTKDTYLLIVVTGKHVGPSVLSL